MVGLRRIAGSRADADVFLGNQLRGRERFARRIAPELSAHALVHALGERLGEPIGQRLDHDGGIIVVGVLEAIRQIILAQSRGDDERADVILDCALDRGDEIGQREIGPALALCRLLAQAVQDRDGFLAGFVGEQRDVVADAVRGPEADRGRGAERALVDEALQHRPRVLIKTARRDAVFLVLENRRKSSRELPGRKKRRPVDVVDELAERVIGKCLGAEKARPRRRIARPVEFGRILPRRLEREPMPVLVPARVRGGDLRIFGADLGNIGRAALRRAQRRRNAHRAARVGDIDRLAAPIVRMDFHRGMHAAGRRAADQERQIEALALHLGRDVAHFVKRRRDQARQPDHVGALTPRRLQDLGRRNHDAEIDHLVIVALEHDADDVLADVVDIALDRRHHDFSGGARLVEALLALLLLHERHQVRDRLLHHAGRFHHLRQEHLSGAEQIAHDVHAGHQRALDHAERPIRGAPRFLGIRDDEIGDAVDERVAEPLLDRPVSPGKIRRFSLFPAALEALGEREQPLGRVLAAV